MPHNLFEQASKSYNELAQAGKWPPANNSARLPGAAPQPSANAVPTQGPHVQAFANALLQVMNKDGKGPNVPNPNKNACHNCGSTDHFKRDCPKLKGGSGGGGGFNNKKPGAGNGNRKSQRNNPGRRQESAWKTKPPGPNEPTEKMTTTASSIGALLAVAGPLLTLPLPTSEKEKEEVTAMVVEAPQLILFPRLATSLGARLPCPSTTSSVERPPRSPDPAQFPAERLPFRDLPSFSSSVGYPFVLGTSLRPSRALTTLPGGTRPSSLA